MPRNESGDHHQRDRHGRADPPGRRCRPATARACNMSDRTSSTVISAKTTASLGRPQPPPARLTRAPGRRQLWPCLLASSSAAVARFAAPSVPPATRTPRFPSSPPPLLADGPMELDNIPRIRDVETMLALLVDLGAHGRVDRRRTPSGSTRRTSRPKPLDPGSAPGSGRRSSSPARCSAASAR